jgi:branched-chain amino acid transport system substrate-binding protein
MKGQFKMVRKIDIKGIVITTILCIFIWCFVNCAPKESKVIRIGAVLPLTGDAAVWGKNTQEGIDLAVEELNKEGGIKGKKIEIVYEDSKALPQNGVSAIQKLITVDKVTVVIDNSVSSVCLAMAPIAEQNQVVILSTGSTAPKVSEAGDYIFRIWNSDALEGKVMADYAFDSLNLKTTAIMFINNDYGVGLQDVFSREFQKKTGKILTSESFNQNESNFRTQLAKIKNTNPQALYLVGYPKEIPSVLKQAKELGTKAQVLGTVAFEDPQIITVAGDASEGLIYPYPVEPNKEDMAVKEFLTKYKAKYNKEPGITCDVGYDAVNMIAKAVESSGGETGPDIQKGLMMIKDFHGASGVMTFDENGDVNKSMGMKIIKEGKFVWYQKQ